MPYDDVPTADLTCHPDNQADFEAAHLGQWFVGVLDTNYKRVYLLPIDPRASDGGRNNNASRSMNRYASGASPDLPPVDWTSCSAHWQDETPGHTTHERVCYRYGLVPLDCLGFTLIKVAPHFAQLKGSSNSLNLIHGGEPTHSFSRATYSRSSDFTPGTVQMPQHWADKLLEFLRGDPLQLTHVVQSND